MDALDPQVAPSLVDAPVPGGLSLQEMEEAICCLLWLEIFPYELLASRKCDCVTRSPNLDITFPPQAPQQLCPKIYPLRRLYNRDVT